LANKLFILGRERERERKIEAHNLATKVLYLIVSERERLKAHNLAKKVLVFFSVYKREKLEAHKDGKLEAFVE
jgi:hypothetical protein